MALARNCYTLTCFSLNPLVIFTFDLSNPERHDGEM